MPLYHSIFPQQQRAAYSPEQAFNNLFQLISDPDNYLNNASSQTKDLSKESSSKVPSKTFARAFNPRFDVRETENAYELHGELAGLDRENVSIEFSGDQTLVVSGRIERKYEKTQDPATEADHHHSVQSSPSLKATVADEETESLKELGGGAVVVGSEQAAPKETKETFVAAASANTTKQPRAHYWFQERSVGQFRRVFEFPVPVNEDAVKASLENGILSIHVPKAAKRETRRIALS